MAKWRMINSLRVTLGSPAAPTFFTAGDLIDDSVQPTAPITNAGGIIAPDSDAIINTAALAAQKLKRAGQPWELCDGLMAAAFASASYGKAQNRAVSTRAAGQTVAAAAAIVPNISFTPKSSGKILIRAWASVQGFAAGTFTPVVKNGSTVIAAPAQYTGAATNFPCNVMVEIEVDGLTVGTAVTLSFVSTAGDATVTLGNSNVGIGAQMTVVEVP